MIERSRPAAASLITGFLGSGKTTLLNALLRHPSLANTAVIVNEFGDIALDHLLIKGGDDQVVLLSNGCLCCALLDSFKETLADLLYRRARDEVPSFDRVVVETSGLADPAPMLQTLLKDPVVAPYYTLNGVVTLIDATHGAHQVEEHREARQQLILADRIVVTKTDLTDNKIPDELTAIFARLNPLAPVITTRPDAPYPPDLLAPMHVPRALPVDQHDHAHGHNHSHGEHDTDIVSHSFVIDRPATWAGLAGWIDFAREFFGDNLLRCKGLIEIAETGKPVLIQGVRRVFAPTEPIAWPDSDHRSRLTCIVKNVDTDVLKASLTILNNDAGTFRPASVEDLMAQATRH